MTYRDFYQACANSRRLGSGLLKKYLFLISLLCFSQVQTVLATEENKRAAYSLSANQFLKLPGDLQFFYVAGALDGMTLLSRENGLKTYDNFIECYRSITLGAFTKKVVIFIRSSSDKDLSVAELIIQTAADTCGDELIK